MWGQREEFKRTHAIRSTANPPHAGGFYRITGSVDLEVGHNERILASIRSKRYRISVGGFRSFRNRKAEAATYSRHSSKVSHRLRCSSATRPVTFDPPKMSTTRSPGSVSILMKNSGSFAGKRAGCGSLPILL